MTSLARAVGASDQPDIGDAGQPDARDARAGLAIVGALTRTLGNWLAAVFGVVGGIGYALAGGTAAFTPVFDFLFPTALGIALWMIAAGVGLLMRRRSAA